eukprot:TRINITY_DN75948_c0_g1_i1.p1 TRINITY_DN75948_c0_g1~~TRINITY_DN75948_c0_g1_i1.p1  ORF type:complete len:301 (+),score=66.36 TRINITY_DN75948_c0_g1_i1:112-903(+)
MAALLHVSAQPLDDGSNNVTLLEAPRERGLSGGFIVFVIVSCLMLFACVAACLCLCRRDKRHYKKEKNPHARRSRKRKRSSTPASPAQKTRVEEAENSTTSLDHESNTTPIADSRAVFADTYDSLVLSVPEPPSPGANSNSAGSPIHSYMSPTHGCSGSPILANSLLESSRNQRTLRLPRSHGRLSTSMTSMGSRNGIDRTSSLRGRGMRPFASTCSSPRAVPVMIPPLRRTESRLREGDLSILIPEPDDDPSLNTPTAADED